MSNQIRKETGSGVHEGYVRPGFEPVVDQFQRNLVESGDRGAAFALYRDGQPLVDIWGGTRDRLNSMPWKHDTAAAIYSGTKALTVACIGLLLQRQQLELDKAVSYYWPEFRRAGKGHITVEQLLSHRAGLPGLGAPVTLEQATDSVKMAQLLQDQPATHVGELRYHALTLGWLCDALIRRIDGRSTGQMLHDEFASPMNLDLWIGVPTHVEPQVAWTHEASQPRAGPGRPAPIGSAEWRVWRNPPRLGVHPLPANLRSWRSCEVPAANGVATASSMARFFDSLLEHSESRGPVGGDTVAMMTQRLVEAEEPILGQRMAFGVGFQLQSAKRPFGPFDGAFGHAGTGGSIHGADPETGLAFSYVTRTLDLGDDDSRGSSLLAAAARCVGHLRRPTP